MEFRNRLFLPIILILALLFFLFLSFDISAQKVIEDKHQTWTQYFLTLRFSEKMSFQTDALYRWNDLVGHQLQSGIRGGISYQIKPAINFTSGYVYMHQYGNSSGAPNKSEHRPWQQVTFNSTLGKLLVNHRYRLEERWMEKNASVGNNEQYGFNFRLRYQLQLQLPLNKKNLEKGTFYSVLFDEVFINFGKQIVLNYFDQNRASFGLGYYFTKSLHANLSYIHSFVQKPSGNRFEQINIFRIALIQTIDLKKKSEE